MSPLDLVKRSELSAPLSHAQMDQNWTDIETDVDGLQTATGGLQTAVDGLQTDVDGLQTTIGGLQTDVDGLQTEVDSLQTTDNIAVSVAEFGVVGDGVVNDMAAFQTAANAGVPLFIPAEFNCLFEVTASVNAVIVSTSTFELYGPGKITCVSASGGPHRFRGITIGTVGVTGNTDKDGIIIEGVKFYSAIDKEFSTFIDLQNRGGNLRNVYIKGCEFVYAPSTTPSTRPETGDRWAISWGGDPGDVRDALYVEDNKCIGSMQLTGNGGWPTSYNDISICRNIIRDCYNAGVVLSRTGASVDVTTYTNIKIKDNDIISQWAKLGIFIGADSEGSSPSPGAWDDVEIIGNTIELGGASAVDILIRCPCSDNAGSVITNVRVSNNRCKSTANASLQLSKHTGIAPTAVEANIYGNTFRKDVYISTGSSVILQNNEVLGSLLTQGSGTIVGSVLDAINNTFHTIRMEGSAPGNVRSVGNTYKPLNGERAINVAPSSGQSATLLSVGDVFLPPASGSPTSAVRLATAGATIACTIIDSVDGARNWSAGLVSLNDGHTATVLRSKQLSILADVGNAAYTFSNVTSPTTLVWNTPLTVDRALTLSTTGAIAGTEVKVIRTAAATGAFNLNVGTGPLKALAAGTWCEVTYNGTAWVLTAFGDFQADNVITPQMFGAVGDGVANDAAALLAALNEAGTTGARVQGVPGKTYRIATAVFVSRTATSAPLIFDLNGATLFVDNATGLAGLSVSGSSTPILTTSLSVEPVRGATNVTLTSVSGIQQGDLLEILSPALSNDTTTVYHHYVVSDISGSQVWIEGTIAADINAAQIAADGKTGSIVVNVYRLAKSFQIMNGTINAIDTAGLNTSLIAAYHQRVLVDNVVFTGHTRNQCHIQWCGFANVRDCSFRDYGYVVRDEGYVNNAGHPDSQGFGYGVITSRVYQVFVSNCRGGRGWHMYDGSRGTMHATIENCFLMRNSFGVSSHEGAWFFNIINCVFEGGNGVVGARCVYLTVKGCVFRNMLEQSITYAGGVVEVRIFACLFDTGFTTGTQSTVYNAAGGSATAGVSSTGWERVFEMVGCTHLGVARVHAGFYGTGKLVIKNNALAKGALFYAANLMAETVIVGNVFSDQVSGNLVMSLNTTGAETPTAVLKDNVHNGSFTGSFPCLFYVNTGTPLLYIYDNITNAENLVRFISTTAGIVDCIGNVNRTGRLFFGAATNTVINLFNNIWGATALQSGGVLTTRESDNYSTGIPLVYIVTSNADFIAAPFGSSGVPTILHSGTLTADRTITLSTTNACAGRKFKITRTGGGAFNLSIGGLKNLVQNTWCEVTHNGTAWVLTAYGAL